MDRLTEKAYGIAQIVKARTELNGKVCYYTCGDICKRQDSCRHGCPIQAILDRLAAYQDTGLTPEEVAELAKVKQEGRLVILQRKPNDAYYHRNYDTGELELNIELHGGDPDGQYPEIDSCASWE